VSQCPIAGDANYDDDGNILLKVIISLFSSLTESKKAQQEMRKSALDTARLQKKVKKGDPLTYSVLIRLFLKYVK